MQEIQVGLEERTYPIHIDHGCKARIGELARRALPRCDRLLVVTDSRVGPIHGRALRDALSATDGPRAEILEIPEGETHKRVETVGGVWNYLIAQGYTRQSALVALGGGVVGDIAGFAAATYMRGIPFIQAPTSLLAMVDSSVGGKTGVNHPRAKNIIGAFWQPRLVFIDTACLSTLAPEEFRSGYAEVLKHGVIRDAEYFSFLEDRHDDIFALRPEALEHTVAVSCRIKAAVVAHDEREAGLRAILNCGHTLGHAVEALSNYTVRHGEAVAIGLAAAGRIAVRMGLLDAADAARIETQLARAGLPVRFPALPTQEILARTRSDKKVRDGRVRYILPVAIGDVVIRDDVGDETVARVVEEMRESE